MRRCCSSIRRCSASARWRSASLRARCVGLDARALLVQPPLSSSRRRCSFDHVALLLRLPPARLVLALLAREHVAPELFVLAPPRVPVVLVLARALFGLRAAAGR